MFSTEAITLDAIPFSNIPLNRQLDSHFLNIDCLPID